ncbi:MAG: rhomboid family intramembrane serine protease [Flavobacteriaceae bacterium]|nr:rhomboid family intramembrane serine protease [Bacteroidia bacterium]NNK87570.1 rhomboid family intramembrane serine protease [Flavobacteriaceae bacterium]
MIKLTDTVKHLLIINALMFLGTLAIGNGQVFFKYFALYFPKNDLFQPWQVLTHMFMHGGFMHIFFNMFALWMFGTAVEQVFGSKKFIIFYILSGLGAAVLQLAFMFYQFNSNLSLLVGEGYLANEILDILNQGRYNTRWEAVLGDLKLGEFVTSFNTTMVGASGAIMGVLVAFGMLFPNSKLMLIFLPIPIKAKYFIPAIIVLDLVSALTGQSFFSPSNTAYVAHVGGALTGFLLMYFWKKNQFDNYRWN